MMAMINEETIKLQRHTCECRFLRKILRWSRQPSCANTDDDGDEKNNRNIITDPGSTALYTAYTVDTVYTVDMVYTVDLVYIVVWQSE